MKDPVLQNGTDARLEARGYRAEQELVQTVEEMSDRATHVAEQAKSLVQTTKAFSKPVLVGAVVASAAAAGGLVWVLTHRRRPSTFERLFAPRPRRSTVLPMLGRAAASLALAAASTAARTFLLAKLEHAIESALEPSEAATSS